MQSKVLDKAIKDVNKLMPVYKTIRYYVYSYEELIKTTSMKIKRYVETAEIRSLFGKLATSIKKTTGRNIDRLKKCLQKGQKLLRQR